MGSFSSLALSSIDFYHFPPVGSFLKGETKKLFTLCQSFEITLPPTIGCNSNIWRSRQLLNLTRTRFPNSTPAKEESCSLLPSMLCCSRSWGCSGDLQLVVLCNFSSNLLVLMLSFTMHQQYVYMCGCFKQNYSFPNIIIIQVFSGLGLDGNTTSLLATGVVGIVNCIFTIPAILWMDKFGRKKLLIAGALGMCICHVIVAAIIGKYHGNFGEHQSAGWAGVAFIYVSISY